MTEAQEDALGTLRSVVEDIADLHQRLYTRLNQGDVPSDVAIDIDGEFGGEFDRIQRSVRAAEKHLADALHANGEETVKE